MAERPSPRLSKRKEPKQARSTGLVAAVLKAAAQVLTEVGAQRFTTARVAAKAGVSVGSLYQYFPNKAAILFRLQEEEWRDTAALLQGILGDRTKPPPQRLRAAVHAFVRSECAEAALRRALGDAAPLYRDAPEAEEPRISGTRAMQAFLHEVLPDVPEPQRLLAGEVLAMALGEVGERVSERSRTDEEVRAHADVLADMFCAYLDQLQRGSEPAKAPRRGHTSQPR